MPDWTIDCSTFLQLTGAELGEYGDYWIDEEGVRGFIDTTPERLKLLESHEQASLLEFNRDARLDFPVSMNRLIRWSNEQAGDVPLPEWFLAAAACKSAAQAQTVLEEAKQALESRLADRKKAESSFEERVEERIHIGDLIGELDAVSFLFRQAGVANEGEERAHSEKERRFDAIGREIEIAIEKLGSSASVDSIMRELQGYAGRDNSCITQSLSNGVLWRDHLGEKKLTRKLLADRLRRANAIGAR